MMLIDNDVLIDIALDRSPHAEPASKLLDIIESGVEPASSPGTPYLASIT